jgi:hypothetical protein
MMRNSGSLMSVLTNLVSQLKETASSIELSQVMNHGTFTTKHIQWETSATPRPKKAHVSYTQMKTMLTGFL